MHGYDLSFSLSLRAALVASAGDTAVAPYTPLWHVRRVIKTSAADWWEGGVPPSRRRHQRATQALSRAVQAATGMAQRWSPPRHTG